MADCIPLLETLAQAEAELPAGSRFRPWLRRIEAEVRDLSRGCAMAAEQAWWLDARRAELSRERALWPLRPVPASTAAARLRRAAMLSRRAGRAARRAGDEPSAAYLTALARLLAVLARAADSDPGVRVRADVRSLLAAGTRPLHGDPAPG